MFRYALHAILSPLIGSAVASSRFVRSPFLCSPFLSLVVGLCLSVSAAQAEILVEDAYARAATPTAKSGAIFMTLRNTGPGDDRLIGASTPIAARAELHSTTQGADGVVSMARMDDGLMVGAGCAALLGRGADHLMLMGLTGGMTQGARFPLTLSFEKAGDLTVDVPVDMNRLPGGPVISGHVNHDHGDMDISATQYGNPSAGDAADCDTPTSR
ncbi:copper chaperone PCu(A)C [Pseudooceanicola sediminis]|uniref:Copper chaperone PCu(A)C n=1 Tax=Pseudooceanicola sediminis TaxID=2211117 RepID=A0A399IWJ1_9RHOB|nr:copper chaperone PCu(A)C [Pseudooceanicola sediminis]KAA2312351.1 copper chaperone PCu(A)C [Puniceibacterium sp. HSS470]RII37401.1 copper chaperone PCu(A)C [Pseudooceanicola sediminis]